MNYFTDSNKLGRVRYGMLPTRIGVFGSPDCLTMIGTALKVGRTEEDLAVWSVRVRMADVQGRWIIVDGSFVPVEQSTKVGDPARPFEHVAAPGRPADSVGKIWKAMWLLGWFGSAPASPGRSRLGAFRSPVKATNW